MTGCYHSPLLPLAQVQSALLQVPQQVRVLPQVEDAVNAASSDDESQRETQNHEHTAHIGGQIKRITAGRHQHNPQRIAHAGEHSTPHAAHEPTHQRYRNDPRQRQGELVPFRLSPRKRPPRK